LVAKRGDNVRRFIIVLALVAVTCGGCGLEKELVLDIPNSSAQIIMKLIPAGKFDMGSPESETDREVEEGPQHQVTIKEPFYMGVYEVTQEQWEAVTGYNPSYFVAPGNPVEQVSWNDCQGFIAELNEKGIGTFRLPTEAEWEYACRAGSETRYFFGDDPGYTEIGDYAWYRDNSGGITHIVGQKEPNAWGLYDMHGNVIEWCKDWYGDYDSLAQTDPQGPDTGSARVIRGSGIAHFAQQCRSAYRSLNAPTDSNKAMGFRLVMIAP